MRYLSICVVLAALVAAASALSAKGGHPLHLFPEQAAGVSLPGDFLGGCGHRRYHDRTGNCFVLADVRDQVLYLCCFGRLFISRVVTARWSTIHYRLCDTL